MIDTPRPVYLRGSISVARKSSKGGSLNILSTAYDVVRRHVSAIREPSSGGET
jgi:hypothetical protein